MGYCYLKLEVAVGGGCKKFEHGRKDLEQIVSRNLDVNDSAQMEVRYMLLETGR